MLVGSRKLANEAAKRQDWPPNDREEFWAPVLMMMLMRSKFKMEPDEMLDLVKILNDEFSTLFFTLSKGNGWDLEPAELRARCDKLQGAETSALGRVSVGAGSSASHGPPKKRRLNS